MATRIERNAPFHWKAAVWAGLIAGAVFLVLEMVLVPLALGESMWGPPRMMAAIVMGERVLPPPATFDPLILLVAMAVHFPLSVLFAIPAAWIVQRMGPGVGATLLLGALWGLALYAINFYAMTAFFPWFAMARNWVSIVGHAVFGFVATWAYLAFRRGGVGTVRTEARDDRQDRIAAD